MTQQQLMLENMHTRALQSSQILVLDAMLGGIFSAHGGVRIAQGAPLEPPETIMDVGLGSSRMQGWESGNIFS